MQIDIQTISKEQLLDITSKVQSLIPKDFGGICILQSQHTTAGLTINENADPDVKTDILKGLKIFDNNNYQHGEGNSPAHIKASLMGPSLTIIVNNGQLQLGTWQGIMLCEFDGPRSRRVIVELIENKIKFMKYQQKQL